MWTQTIWYTNPGGGFSEEWGRGHWFRLRAFQWTAEWTGSAASAVSLLWWWQNRRWQVWRPRRPAPGPASSAQTHRAHSYPHIAVEGAGWFPGAQHLQPSRWTQRCLCWGFWWLRREGQEVSKWGGGGWAWKLQQSNFQGKETQVRENWAKIPRHKQFSVSHSGPGKW